MRITQGKLQTSLIETLKSLVHTNKVQVFQSVKYTTSSSQMERFMRRGTLPNISKQYKNDKTTEVSKEFFNLFFLNNLNKYEQV